MLNGINHAAQLPAMDNKDLQVLMGTRLSEYIIYQYRRTLAIELFLQIDSSLDICNTVTYLVEDHAQLPSMSDSAVDAAYKRQTLSPPRTLTFHGFCKGGFEIKMDEDQMECINQFPVLKMWYNDQLATAIENGRNALMTRFYRTLLTSVHPKNTGNSAGLTTGGQVVGAPSAAVLFDKDNADAWFKQVVNVIKQMPRTASVPNEFGHSSVDGFIFGPQEIESVLMSVSEYNRYDSVGDCGSCALFRDYFPHKPRGLDVITSYCVESLTCLSGGEPQTVYPILFGKRYRGAKASIRLKNKTYMEDATGAMINQIVYYWHMHVYDCRFLGKGHIVVNDEKPILAPACD